jgi:uncharacterized protein with NAD-binding domain and iron-sulfur cluster
MFQNMTHTNIMNSQYEARSVLGGKVSAWKGKEESTLCHAFML